MLSVLITNTSINSQKTRTSNTSKTLSNWLLDKRLIGNVFQINFNLIFNSDITKKNNCFSLFELKSYQKLAQKV